MLQGGLADRQIQILINLTFILNYINLHEHLIVTQKHLYLILASLDMAGNA